MARGQSRTVSRVARAGAAAPPRFTRLLQNTHTTCAFQLPAGELYHLFTILSADWARGFWARSARAVRADICVARGPAESACDERHLLQLTAGGGPANFGGGTSALKRGKP